MKTSWAVLLILATLPVQGRADGEPDRAAALQLYEQARASLAKVPKKGDPCEEALGEAWDLFREALANDPGLAEKARKDPGLSRFSSTFEFHRLVGRSTERAEDVKTILQAVHWYQDAGGVQGSMMDLTFLPKGQAVLRRAVFSPEGERLRPQAHRAVYTVQGAQIELRFKGPISQPKQFEGDEVGPDFPAVWRGQLDELNLGLDFAEVWRFADGPSCEP